MYYYFVCEFLKALSKYYFNYIKAKTNLFYSCFCLTTIKTIQVSTVGDPALTKWRKRRKKIPETEDNRPCLTFKKITRKKKASNTTGENPCRPKHLGCKETFRPQWHSGCSTQKTSRFSATQKSQTGCETGKTPEWEENR